MQVIFLLDNQKALPY